MVDEGRGPDRGDAPASEVASAREALLRHLVTFARALRERDVEVPADGTLTAARALAVVGIGDRERVRAALRAALINRREDLETFEHLFPVFWHGIVDGGTVEGGPAALGRETPGPGLGGVDEDAPTAGPGDVGGAGDGPTLESRLEPAGAVDRQLEPGASDERTAVYSPTGRSEPVDAAAGLLGVPDDVAEPVRVLTDALASRRGRRWTAGGDTRPDVRRALRRSVETGGTVLDLPGRERRRSAVRAVVLVDVSRSVLDTVDRGFLVRFLRAVRANWRDVAIFFFDTSVREVSDAFDAPTAEAALDALEAAETAWGGGTRIGHAVETVRREHPTLVDRDTVVLVVSDGLEVGEVDVLERGMAWLSRRAAAVLWANPLAGAAGYEPTCRGMAASLPYVDGLFAFSGPADVAEMARQLSQRGLGGRVGYEQDPRRRAPAGARKR